MCLYSKYPLRCGGPGGLTNLAARGGVSAAQSAYGGRSNAVLESVWRNRKWLFTRAQSPAGLSDVVLSIAVEFSGLDVEGAWYTRRQTDISVRFNPSMALLRRAIVGFSTVASIIEDSSS